MITLNEHDTILFIGDSITHGGRGQSMDLNHIMGHSFPFLVSSRLSADFSDLMLRFANKGVGGDTSGNIYSRWGTDVIQYSPAVINLLVGINDVGSGLMLPPQMVCRKYIATVDSILRDTFELLPDVKFFLCEPFYVDVQNQENPYQNIPHPFCERPFPFGNNPRREETIGAFEERVKLIQNDLPELAAKYKSVVYIPFQDLFDKAIQTTPASYFIWDNVHPTMVGHQLLADRWLSIAGKILTGSNPAEN